jgi:hypothetical protein
MIYQVKFLGSSLYNRNYSSLSNITKIFHVLITFKISWDLRNSIYQLAKETN